MNVQPFTINVPQAVLDDLHKRLTRTRWADEVEGAGWEYGVNRGHLKAYTDYWQNDYDWRKHEAELNQFAHFKADVDGIGAGHFAAWEAPEAFVGDLQAFFRQLR